jgi:drug/metabolite transporter (DMT)-like permease
MKEENSISQILDNTIVSVLFGFVMIMLSTSFSGSDFAVLLGILMFLTGLFFFLGGLWRRFRKNSKEKVVEESKQPTKGNKKLIFGLLILLGFLFYWYELRPAQIKSDCAVEEGFDLDRYQRCLHENGL